MSQASDSYHVKTNGTPSGDGTINNPWDLQTALNHPNKVKPGDTIWIHEGIYTGVFTSNLTGNSSAPIIVRAAKDKEVILDGNIDSSKGYVLSFEGQYTWIWGITILNTNENRTNNPNLPIDNKDGVSFTGSNCKLINCIIRDNGGGGIGFWQTAINSEIYGCIIYHNGYIGEDRGHGHAIYIQNNTGTKLITDNIFFNSFGMGIHAYTEGGNIKGYTIDGNIMFNCGLPYSVFLDRHILVGGYQPADRVMISNNYFYNRPMFYKKEMIELGYSVPNNNISFLNNYMVNGQFYIRTRMNCLILKYNTLISSSSSEKLITNSNFSLVTDPQVDYNTYHKGKLGNSPNFEHWKSYTGQDFNSSYDSQTPSSTFYYLKENHYEKGCAILAIYNWEMSEYVEVDASELLSSGDEYELWDVQNLSNGPIKTETFNSKITVPMNLTAIDLPYGNIPNTNIFAHTAPSFGVFNIKKTKSSEVSQINKNSDFSLIEIYPNPTENQVYTDFIAPFSGTAEIGIYDISGRLVQSETVITNIGKNNYSCNLGNLEIGSYILVISNQNDVRYSKIIQKK